MNAIILAAGIGSRISKLSHDFHKALLPVDGKPNIERTIDYLKTFGVNDITLVVGHNADLFNYLKDKYSCNIVHNDKYLKYNNIYSLYLARDFLSDTLVIDADVVLLKNIFTKKDKSFYYTLLRDKSDQKEWVPIVNEQGRVVKIEISNEYKPSLLGISYWNKDDCKIIKDEMEKYISEDILSDSKLYWDNVILKVLDRIYVVTHEISPNDATEIDTEENYKNVCKRFL